MKPISNFRLCDKRWLPDVDDCFTQGLKTSLGGKNYFKGISHVKKAIRRTWKRSDKNKHKMEMRLELC